MEIAEMIAELEQQVEKLTERNHKLQTAYMKLKNQSIL